MSLHTNNHGNARPAPALQARAVKYLTARSLLNCHAIRLARAPTSAAVPAERYLQNGCEQRPQLNGAAS